ncbi:F-box protein At3g12350-like [Zingiber officinale]|uniref:F-box protein At3g12350-like n=1 Tax=Zingiber officinale TaxID=94328 RepID=UPI001C4CF7AD|nr:F-box protein At3g12350-like [Zingiber officinale]
MASSPPDSEMSFSDFPEDVQINILSFLSPSEVSAFACTSRRFAALCGVSDPDSALWLAMCERRWGSCTSLRSWSSSPAASFSRLYKELDRWESLIGFWRRIGRGGPHLVFFEWGPSYIAGSRIFPAPDACGEGYGVLKVPFLWLGLSRCGEAISLLHPGGCSDSSADLLGTVPDSSVSPSGFSDRDLVPVSINFMGCSHFVVEDGHCCADGRTEDSTGFLEEIEATSPPDRLMSEIYKHFANRTSPSGDRAMRRQRKKERGRFGRQHYLEPEHFVKINNYYPTPDRPLQGLWKGISEDMLLEFYLVSYDDIGGITCRRVSEGEQFSGYSPVFWTSNTTFLESPFSKEEQDLYGNREHIHLVASNPRNVVSAAVLRILCISSSYDLSIPSSSASTGDSKNVEGRVWEYDDGTFGFGFFRNNYVVDLKHIALSGSLLDTVEYFSNHSSL